MIRLSGFLLHLFLLSALPLQAQVPAAGLSWSLAEHRARTISNVEYDIGLRLPAATTERITGSLTLRFDLRAATQPLVLDFDAPDGSVTAIRDGSSSVAWEILNGHIVIPASALRTGPNRLDIEFIAGDAPLNRNPDFLYTLFVPDRASNAIPLFDQPDIKAVYRLTLDVPADWEAVANGAVASTEDPRPFVGSADDAGARRRLTFAPTKPISTYLFSFAAGKFRVETAQRDGRVMRMLHRETDSAKVARNRDAIFDLHASALRWLEEYTGIDYPFGKFDFVLIPSFQYGGMEHPGAILYNAARLMLDEAATQSELLGRASLIAHETAHMWFGDLVTMRWFDDVWMKEVFANFMAAKIVNPSFPDIDHDLRFLLAHHPAAYGVDRTAGTHAIRQQLDNLAEAGSLYGAIIYQKAPIVMRQLEALMGEGAFRDGMREYLTAYAYGNATWRDLVAILDRRHPEDLASWSRVWVEEPGRPTIRAAVRGSTIVIEQADESGGARVWPQIVDPMVGSRTARNVFRFENPVASAAAATTVPAPRLDTPEFVLPDVSGYGYARFQLDERTRAVLLDSLLILRAPVARGVALLALHDAMLEGEVAPDALLRTLMRTVRAEPVQLLTERYLGLISDVYWRFLTPAARHDIAAELEALLWSGLEAAPDASSRASWFGALRSIAITDASVARLRSIWAREDSIPGLPLVERDYTALAQMLALRGVSDADAILEQQLARIDNPDRRARFEFILPALSSDEAVRERFFESLKDVRNRSHEPWVLDGLSALNHPLRAEHAERFIRPGLELLPEIQRTGDIFFPRRWVDALLAGHATPSAAAAVREYLEATPQLAPRLRGIVLQAADDVFRAAALR